MWKVICCTKHDGYTYTLVFGSDDEAQCSITITLDAKDRLRLWETINHPDSADLDDMSLSDLWLLFQESLKISNEGRES